MLSPVTTHKHTGDRGDGILRGRDADFDVIATLTVQPPLFRLVTTVRSQDWASAGSRPMARARA
jgi:hypothetical protein